MDVGRWDWVWDRCMVIGVGVGFDVKERVNVGIRVIVDV